jgi:hypothetical protein
MKKQRDMDVAQAALRGAMAGAVGGALMLAAEQLAEHRVFSRNGSAVATMGSVANSAARRTGQRLSKSQRSTAGVVLHLAFTTALGALYGAARSRSRLSKPAIGLLDSGLVYAASLTEREERSRSKRLRRKSQARKGRIPVSPHALFGLATVEAFELLARTDR